MHARTKREETKATTGWWTILLSNAASDTTAEEERWAGYMAVMFKALPFTGYWPWSLLAYSLRRPLLHLLFGVDLWRCHDKLSQTKSSLCLNLPRAEGRFWACCGSGDNRPDRSGTSVRWRGDLRGCVVVVALDSGIVAV
eukprot:s6123_g1.t1